VLVIVTAHTEFRNMNPKEHIKLIVDGRNILNKDIVKAKGISYVGIGRH
ncbi:MAG: UDP-glucose 6-dehydrogenase, partial [Nitrospiraceae bacterium]|nr:UDP-glucose 6-dehydrogenase [Nitrospiraceae bacterium]